MSSNNKAYALVETSNERSEADIIPQGIPVQNQFPQYVQPQYQMPGYAHPQMMPSQFIQQPMPHYVGGAPQFIRNAPQFQTTDLYQMNPAQLTAKHQEQDQEIRKYQHMVTVNWILIVLQVIGGVFGVVFIAVSLSMLDFICDVPQFGSNSNNSTSFGYPDNNNAFGGHYKPTGTVKNQNGFNINRQDCIHFFDGVGTGFIVIAIFLITLFSSLMIFLHYMGIVAYRKRRPESMECMFVCYTVLFVLNALGINCVGMAAYGYLAYSAHKLKTAFAEILKIERAMTAQGMGNVPANPISYPNPQVQMVAL